jgi:hypothetical protein
MPIAQRLGLGDKVHLKPSVLRPGPGLDLLAHVSDHKDNFINIGSNQFVDNVRQDGLAGNEQQPFGLGVCMRPQPNP